MLGNLNADWHVQRDGTPLHQVSALQGALLMGHKLISKRPSYSARNLGILRRYHHTGQIVKTNSPASGSSPVSGGNNGILYNG